MPSLSGMLQESVRQLPFCQQSTRKSLRYGCPAASGGRAELAPGGRQALGWWQLFSAWLGDDCGEPTKAASDLKEAQRTADRNARIGAWLEDAAKEQLTWTEPEPEQTLAEEEGSDLKVTPPVTNRAERAAQLLERNVTIASKWQILSYSLVHQGLLVLLGLVGSYLLPSMRWWVPCSSYGIVGAGMWLTHWAGHRKIIPGWFDFHVIGHHVHNFPPSRFLCEKYRPVTSSAFDMNIALYCPWPLVSASLHYALAAATTAELLLCLFVSCALIVESELLHSAVHQLDCRLEGLQWFDVMRKMHFLHHKEGMKHNYAMSDFLFDFLSGNLMNMY